jgi:hypothetical protein
MIQSSQPLLAYQFGTRTLSGAIYLKASSHCRFPYHPKMGHPWDNKLQQMTKIRATHGLSWLERYVIKSSKKTPNYFHLQKFFKECFDELENKHFSKWIFMNSHDVKVSYLNGKKISYVGDCSFEGSPRTIFWSSNYIPEYIKDFCFQGIKEALKNSKDFNINPNRCLEELKLILLDVEIGKTYGRMADIDSRLLGDGIRIPPKRNTASYTNTLTNNLHSTIESHKITKLSVLIFWIKTHPLIKLTALAIGGLLLIQKLLGSISSFFK